MDRFSCTSTNTTKIGQRWNLFFTGGRPFLLEPLPVLAPAQTQPKLVRDGIIFLLGVDCFSWSHSQCLHQHKHNQNWSKRDRFFFFLVGVDRFSCTSTNTTKIGQRWNYFFTVSLAPAQTQPKLVKQMELIFFFLLGVDRFSCTSINTTKIGQRWNKKTIWGWMHADIYAHASVLSCFLGLSPPTVWRNLMRTLTVRLFGVILVNRCMQMRRLHFQWCSQFRKSLEEGGQEARLGARFSLIPCWHWCALGRSRLFPRRHRFLTEEEYILEGEVETKKALSELRQYCRSPDCNAWKVISRLNSPSRSVFCLFCFVAWWLCWVWDFFYIYFF